ncbi:DinB family protein [Bryobacter aggregatus]|uniref:DinB family protein n=1 Tax=Bryobacter aggregatus TaxID=360054 RepID=UPI00068CE0BF|nr:DinB family protein [Bryobacter aggregatus]
MTHPEVPLIDEIHQVFIRSAVARLRQQESRIEDCLAKLTDDQIWSRGNENSNSIGNMILHLVGNLGQWVLHGIGGQADIRQREEEFAARSGPGKVELAARLRARMEEVVAVLEAIPSHRLLSIVEPQGYRVPVLEVVTHVTEHFYYHGGQILLLTKLYLDTDLGYYRHLSQGNTAHSESVP